MKLTLPTWLTLLRIVMIPVLVLVFYLPYTWTNFASAAIFGLAAITDWLDGWIAPLPAGVGLRRVPRSGRGQADGGSAVPDRAGPPDAVDGAGRRSSSAAQIACRRCANGWPNRGQRAKVRVAMIGSSQDHRADGRAAVPAVFGGPQRAGGRHLDGLAGVPYRRLDPGHCRGADPVVGPAVPARRLAEPAR